MTRSRYSCEFCSGDLFETHSAGACLIAVHRGFAFHVSHPA
jgi:hypothetical protein